MKPKLTQPSSLIHRLAKLACGNRLIRLHPKFRWLSYVCPILQRRTPALRSPTSAVAPPHGPPRLRLRKRRRLSVRSTNHPQR